MWCVTLQNTMFTSDFVVNYNIVWKYWFENYSNICYLNIESVDPTAVLLLCFIKNKNCVWLLALIMQAWQFECMNPAKSKFKMLLIICTVKENIFRFTSHIHHRIPRVPQLQCCDARYQNVIHAKAWIHPGELCTNMHWKSRKLRSHGTCKKHIMNKFSITNIFLLKNAYNIITCEHFVWGTNQLSLIHFGDTIFLLNKSLIMLILIDGHLTRCEQDNGWFLWGQFGANRLNVWNANVLLKVNRLNVIVLLEDYTSCQIGIQPKSSF